MGPVCASSYHIHGFTLSSFPDASNDSHSYAVSRLSLACLEGIDHSHLTLEISRRKVQLQLLSSAAAGRTPWRYCVIQSWATWISLTHLKLIGGKSQISGDSNQRMVRFALTASPLAVLGMTLVLGSTSERKQGSRDLLEELPLSQPTWEH